VISSLRKALSASRQELGSTVSALIAQQGHRVQLFERERFPRFHIGESLIPETYWVLKRLGMLEKLRNSHFVKKYSVQFVSSNGKLSAPFYFWDNKPHECSQTWQVVRSEFDQMMLNNARECGVEAHEGARVREVVFEDGRAVGVRIQRADDSQEEIRARVVVDASGQSGLLMHKLNLRVWDPILNKGAIWTYWQGAYRDTGRDEGATVVIQTTMSSRRWRATRAPSSVPSSTTPASCRGRRGLACGRLCLSGRLRLGDRPDVVVELGARRGLLLDVAVGHVLALGDQVYEHAKERQEDHEHAPGRLPPATDVVPPEDVGEDPEQDQEPRDPEEEDEYGPEDVHERVVSCNQHGASLEPRRVIRNHPHRVRA